MNNYCIIVYENNSINPRYCFELQEDNTVDIVYNLGKKKNINKISFELELSSTYVEDLNLNELIISEDSIIQPNIDTKISKIELSLNNVVEYLSFQNNTRFFTGSIRDTIEQIEFNRFKNNIKNLGDKTFEGCKALQKLTTSDKKKINVQRIGYRAFAECKNLAETNFQFDLVANKNSEIDKEAFFNCANFNACNDIDIIKSDTQSMPFIGEGAFAQTKTTGIPDWMDSINNEGIFLGCNSITTIDLSNIKKQTYIPQYTFKDCKNLTTITWSTNINEIKGGAFRGCSSLMKDIDSYLDLSHIAVIGDYAFEGCTGLTKVRLASNVKLGKGAFANCTFLKSVLFAVSDETDENSTDVIELGKEAFANCKELIQFETGDIDAFVDSTEYNNIITQPIKSIGDKCFDGIGIKKIKMTLTNNDGCYGARVFNSCTKLKIFECGFIDKKQKLQFKSDEDGFQEVPQDCAWFTNCTRLQEYKGPPNLLYGFTKFYDITNKENKIIPSYLQSITFNYGDFDKNKCIFTTIIDLNNFDRASDIACICNENLTSIETIESAKLFNVGDLFRSTKLNSDKISKLYLIGKKGSDFENYYKHRSVGHDETSIFYVGDNVQFNKTSLGYCLKEKTCLRFNTNHILSDLVNYNTTEVTELWYIGTHIKENETEFPYSSIQVLRLSPDIESIGYLFNSCNQLNHIYSSDDTSSYPNEHAFAELKRINTDSLCLIDDDGNVKNFCTQSNMDGAENFSYKKICFKGNSEILLDYEIEPKPGKANELRINLTDYEIIAKNAIRLENTDSNTKIKLILPFIGYRRYLPDAGDFDSFDNSFVQIKSFFHKDSWQAASKCINDIELTNSESLLFCGKSSSIQNPADAIFADLKLTTLTIDAPVQCYDKWCLTFEPNNTIEELIFTEKVDRIPQYFCDSIDSTNAQQQQFVTIQKIDCSQMKVSDNEYSLFEVGCFYNVNLQKLEVLYLPQKFQIKYQPDKHTWFNFNQIGVTIPELYYPDTFDNFIKNGNTFGSNSQVPFPYALRFYIKNNDGKYVLAPSSLNFNQKQVIPNYLLYNNRFLNDININTINLERDNNGELLVNSGDVFGTLKNNSLIEMYGSNQSPAEGATTSNLQRLWLEYGVSDSVSSKKISDITGKEIISTNADVKLIFYKYKHHDTYFLTKIEGTPEDDTLTLPNYFIEKVDNDKNIYHTYAIYSYAFWGDQNIKKLILPSTIRALWDNCFAGSMIEEVEIRKEAPPYVNGGDITTLRSRAQTITFSCPRKNRAQYIQQGWKNYVNSSGNTYIEVKYDSNVINDNGYIKPLTEAYETDFSLSFAKNIISIDPTAYIGARSNEFNLIEGVDTGPYTIIHNGNTIFKEIDSNTIEIIKYYGNNFTTFDCPDGTNIILKTNSLYQNPTLANSKRLIKIDWTNTNVIAIEELVFQGCQALESITIGPQTNYIARNAFYNCNNLSEIIVDQGNTKYSSSSDKKHLQLKNETDEQGKPITIISVPILN